MTAKYQLYIGGAPHHRIFDRIEDAKQEGRKHARRGASVHIEIFPPVTSPPAEMRASRFDHELQDWVDTGLPLG